MAQWCDACGQRITGRAAHTHGVWLDDPSAEHDEVRPPTGERKRGVERALMAGVAAVALLWLGFLGVGSLLDSNDGVDERVEAEREQAEFDRQVEAAVESQVEQRVAELEAQRPTPTPEPPEPDDRENPVPTLPDEILVRPGQLRQIVEPGDAPRVQEEVRRTPGTQRLARAVGARDKVTNVAYESAAGVVLIDLASGQSWILGTPQETDVPQLGAALLRSGTSTYAIDPASRQLSLVGTGATIVMTSANDDAIHVADSASLGGPTPLVEVAAESEVKRYRMPRQPGGLQLRAFDGVGLAAVPNNLTGASLISTIRGFDELSEFPVLAASQFGLLEQKCTAGAGCRLSVRDNDGNETALPEDFARLGDRYAMAPNGQAILRYSGSGFGEALLLQEQGLGTAWVTRAGMNAPAWSSSSDYIVWLDLIDEPQLKVMFLDDREWVAVDLVDYAVPDPVNHSIVVFEHEGPSPAGDG